MSEEKKEEKQDAQQQERLLKDQETKPQPPKTEVVKAQTPKKERAVNCAVCNKSIRKKRYYYRNGKYFCTKRCWKTTVKKESKAAAKV